MSALVIPTPRLDLVLQSPEEALAMVEALSPEVRAEVSPDWLARVRTTAAGDPWALGFTVVERATGAAIGHCGFKGPPDGAGMVELAYGIDLNYQGQGFATEAAQALTAFAFANNRVRLVRGHTRPDNLASARVLAKCGFQFVGEVEDPEDGLVHRWEQTRAEPA